MSAEAIMLFKRDLREKLKAGLSCEAMEAVVDAVDELLCDYALERVAPEETGSDYMLGAFLEAMRVEGRSPKTLERYEYILGRLLAACGVATGRVTTYHVRRYLADEKKRGIADSTIRGYREVFGAYFGWLHRDGLIQKNIMGNIGPVKCEKKVKEVFSDIELEKLRGACENPRDIAIFHFLRATGCRISEVTGLNRADVDLEKLQCTVHGKGNKWRVVYMDAVAGMRIREYLAQRTDDSSALFVGLRGAKRLEPGGIRVMLNKLGRRAGVAHVHPHKFRRTAITSLVNHGMPVEQVRTLAGHDKVDTTMGYVVMDMKNVENSYRKYS